MTEENIAVAERTVLEPGTEAVEQSTNVERDLSALNQDKPEKPDPRTSRGDVEKALDKIQADEKAEKTEKPETPNAEKPEAASKTQPKDEQAPKPAEKVSAPADDKTVQEQKGADRRSEGRDYPEAPARFLPKAKEVWRNAPLVVQQEVSRLVQEHDAEITRYKESSQEYESIKHYAERAKQGGTDLKTALDNYVGIEDKLRADPAGGFRAIITNMGMQPSRAIASIMQAYNVTPQQLIQHMTQQPHEYSPLAQRPVQQQQPQQPQPQPQVNPEIQELKQQLQRMQEQQTADNVIKPFIEDGHDRYYELQEDIAFFLQSGKIPNTLSPRERLEAAYDMAERINPSSHYQAPQTTQHEDPESLQRRAEPDLNGTKSVKGAPNGGMDSPPKRFKSTRDAVKAAMSANGM